MKPGQAQPSQLPYHGVAAIKMTGEALEVRSDKRRSEEREERATATETATATAIATATATTTIEAAADRNRVK